MSKAVFLLLVLVCAAAGFGQVPDPTQGSLYAIDRDGDELGACPLKSTAVRADVSGFIARVNVRQEFVNTFREPIEAVYLFPLSEKGAVDRMTMTVGGRVIRGKIMKREEARETYEAAKTEGKTASLLDQERENIFTQSVANIMPGERVVIDISYVETLKYEDGAYEFVFPMVVGPRYIPGSVKDASRISPKASRVRNGSDVSIEVNLNAGVPVEQIRSVYHPIEQINHTPTTAKVTLRGRKTIPNKDFILRYDVTGKRIEDAVLTHRDARGGFFTMILQPPDVPAPEDRTPKEIVFVLDTSGSMDGFPIEKAKEAMRLSLDGLYPDDTFNLITFAGDTEILFDQPVPATQANLDRARAFIANRNGEGGTEMMAAIKASLEPSDSQEHLRIVCFMTDGQVGNDDEIVAEVQTHPRARVFSFGIGDSVNRSLLDRIAQQGKGEATYIALEDDGSKAARQFYERVRTPLLTDLSIDWNGMPVTDIYPSKLTDLFSAKPVTVSGRFTKSTSGKIRLRGLVAGQPYEREIAFNLPENEPANDVLASLWARTRIRELSDEKLKASNSEVTDALDKQITNLGLEYGLLTEFTSFVAVEDRVVNQNGRSVTVGVPLPPLEVTGSGDGVGDGDITIGEGDNSPAPVARNPNGTKRKNRRMPDAKRSIATHKNGGGGGGGRGYGSGSGNGVASGSGGGLGLVATNSAPPPPLAASAVVTVTGTAEIVDATESRIATNLTATQIQALPMGRSFSGLLKIAPGTVRGGYSIDGASGTENTFVMDGTPLGSDSSIAKGRVILAVKPDSPGVTRVQEVAVEIEVDVSGSVVSAKASSGTARLRSISEAAAKLTQFAPITCEDGKPLRLTGTIVYRFGKGRKVVTGLKGMKAAAPTDADIRLIKLSSKLHFWLLPMVKGGNALGENANKFVSSGKAFVRVELKERTAVSLAKVRATGLEIVRESGRSKVEGRIAIDKLDDLALLDEVVLVVPRI